MNNNNFKMIFKQSSNVYDNIKLLYNNCLLQKNKNIYNQLLINYIYYDLPIDDFIILNNDDINNIKQYIQYIVLNNNHIYLGFIVLFNNQNLFLPINNYKNNINYNEFYNYEYLYINEINKYLHPINRTTKLLKDFYKIHKNDKIKQNDKYIVDGEFIIGIQLKYGDFIPIKIKSINDYELKPEDILEGYISYKNKIGPNESKKILEDLTKDNINNILHYENYIYFVSHIIYKDNLKSSINSIINKKESIDEKNIELKSFFKNKISKYFDINTNINLEYDTIKNQYIINSKNQYDKFIIDQNNFELFLDYIVNELLYNKYKSNIILNNLLDNKIINNNSNEYIELTDIDFQNNFKIQQLYNYILTDNFNFNIGTKYNKQQLNKHNFNKNYCQIKKYITDIDKNKYVYYSFKPLNNLNDNYYTNCIFYHIGKNVLKYKKNIVLTFKKYLINLIEKSLKEKSFTLKTLIELYIQYTNNNIYNYINNLDDLKNIISSDNHYLTDIDLLLIAEDKNLVFLVYTYNKDKILDNCNYIFIENSNNIELTPVRLLKENIYNISLFYYMEQYN